MAGFTQAYQQTLLDYAFPNTAATDHIAYSANGTSEAAGLARTPIGATGWNAATAATPSVKANKNTLVSAAASAAVTISHFAVYDAATGGVQKTDWQALTGGARALAIGDKLEWAAGACSVTLD